MKKPGMKLNMQTNEMIRQLGKRGNRLQVVAAEAVNETAEKLDGRYKKNLKKNQTLRNERYTLGAVRTYKSNPIRRSGEPRKLENINAKTVVLQKNKEDHYLKKLEEGNRNKGNKKTGNYAPVPITKPTATSRTSGSADKPIAAANRLSKGNTQILRAGNRKFGVKGDRNSVTGKKFTPHGRFAALYKYKNKGTGNLQGDLSKPFFFLDNSDNLGVFKFIRNRVHKIRTLKYRSTKTKASPNFEKAFNATKPAEIKSTFVKKAQKELGRIK